VALRGWCAVRFLLVLLFIALLKAEAAPIHQPRSLFVGITLGRGEADFGCGGGGVGSRQRAGMLLIYLGIPEYSWSKAEGTCT